jgi:hypothetical protein
VLKGKKRKAEELARERENNKENHKSIQDIEKAVDRFDRELKTRKLEEVISGKDSGKSVVNTVQIDFEEFSKAWNSGSLPFPPLLNESSPIDKELKKYWVAPLGMLMIQTS